MCVHVLVLCVYKCNYRWKHVFALHSIFELLCFCCRRSPPFACFYKVVTFWQIQKARNMPLCCHIHADSAKPPLHNILVHDQLTYLPLHTSVHMLITLRLFCREPAQVPNLRSNRSQAKSWQNSEEENFLIVCRCLNSGCEWLMVIRVAWYVHSFPCGSQMGKFYELFHMDSTTGVQELGLIYMKVTDSFQW